MAIENILADLGFSKPKYIEGRGSVADVFGKNRCGIYVLHFADGAYYIGQATNVVRRYSQHRQTHTDIQNISFKRVGKRKLDSEERAVVKRLEEEGLRLRNIQLVNFSYGETDFDYVMPPSEQQRWLEDLTYDYLEGTRPVDEHLRSLYAKKYERFQNQPHAAEITEVLRQYVQTCIPAVRSSEISFWMCSCLMTKSKEVHLYSRVNIGFQMTLQAYSIEDRLYFGWFITKNLAKVSIDYLDQPIKRLLIQAALTLFQNKPWLNVFQSRLAHGGQNQVCIEVEGGDSALELMKNDDVIRSFRQFNLGLMQKGPCPWGRNHCLDLADRLVE